MASLLCVKQPGGTVQIHNDELIKVLATDTQENATNIVSLLLSFSVTTECQHFLNGL